MLAFDPTTVRPLFPALTRHVAGRPAVFFDAPGGSQVPQSVINGVANYLAYTNANVHGAFATSQETDAVIAAAHTAMADFLGCDPNETVFGANMTTITFALARSIGRELGTGDEVVVTRLEHDANVAPWHALEERGVHIRTVDIDIEDCTLDMSDFADQINAQTRLVAVGYASNAVGTINDVRAIVDMAHRVGAMVFVDAVHYAPHGPINVRTLDCDFLACSAYKFFAPHVACLYGKREHLERLQPYKLRPVPEVPPDRWQTGCKNHEGLAGLTAAIDYLASIGQRVSNNGAEIYTSSVHSDDASTLSPRRQQVLHAMTAIKLYEQGLSAQLLSKLLALPKLRLYGIRETDRTAQRTPTFSFRIEGYTPREVSTHLAELGIFSWNGNFQALNFTERLGVESNGGLVRIGLVHYNTVDEIDRLIEALEQL